MEVQTTYLDEPDKRKLLNRLSRVEGQVRGLKKLVEEAQCADEVLVQAAAARGALGQFMARLIELHLADCVNSCMEGDRIQVSERLSKALSIALKLST